MDRKLRVHRQEVIRVCGGRAEYLGQRSGWRIRQVGAEMNLTRGIRSARGALWSDSNYTRLVLARQVPLEVLWWTAASPRSPHAVRHVPGARW